MGGSVGGTTPAVISGTRRSATGDDLSPAWGSTTGIATTGEETPTAIVGTGVAAAAAVRGEGGMLVKCALASAVVAVTVAVAVTVEAAAASLWVGVAPRSVVAPVVVVAVARGVGRVA